MNENLQPKAFASVFVVLHINRLPSTTHDMIRGTVRLCAIQININTTFRLVRVRVNVRVMNRVRG